MENQPITNPLETTSVNSAPISQPPVPTQVKTNLLIPILLTFLVSAIVFGFSGYYLGTQNSRSTSLTENANVQPTPTTQSSLVNTTSPTIIPTEKPQVDETASWGKYTETREVRFSIKYPLTWTVDTKDGMYGEKGARFDSDKERIGSVGIGWNSQPVEPNCNTGTEKKEIVQIKNRTIEMCHSTGSIQEPEGYFYNSSKNGVNYSIVTSNYPGEENRQAILRVLSTLEI